jgi:Zn-dependent protease with chaperone function
MSTLPTPGYRLTGISPKAFQHPADRAATASLAAVPYLDRVVRKLIELGYERVLRQSYLGSSVRLSDGQLGDVWRQHNIAYATLDMDVVPDLYLTQFPTPNAMAIGAKDPIVVLQSELIRLLDPLQQRAVLAHEAAHILSDHQLYRTATEILLKMTNAARLPLPLGPVRAALLEWSRASELSCDRAAALVTRDPLVVCRTLMIVAAGAEAEALDLDLFMAQGAEYTDGGGGLEKLSRLFIDLGLTHSFPVKRIHELMAWVRSGEYDRIVGGDYLRRGEESPVREEAGDAVSHYSDRVKDTLKDAGESLGSAGQQLADWLKNAGTDRDDEPGDEGPVPPGASG